jgi:cell division protein FtsB
MPNGQQTPKSQTTTTVITKKPKSPLRYKLMITFLLLLILGLLAGGSFLGVQGYMKYRDKRTEASDLQSEVDRLRSQQNLSTVDLQRQIDDLKGKNSNLEAEKTRLQDDLNTSNNKIAQLTPKEIKDLKIDTIIAINRSRGDAWIDPIYVDLTGDGKQDGIYAYRIGGTGNYLNVYAYSYIDNNLSQILKAEEYQKGAVSVSSDTTVEIKFQTGSPDSPETSTTRFKWDGSTKKMVKI